MGEKRQGRVVLEGAAAMELWRQGREAWNAWVEENPKADVDFSEQYFAGTARVNLPPIVDFGEFNFPDGDISFVKAEFAIGDVNFHLANFGKGQVNFSNAKFGIGDVYFSKTNFGEGHTQFSNARFNNGIVIFSNAIFKKGSVSFSSAQFGTGDVFFSSTNFGEGPVYFGHTNFGEGEISFANTIFGAGHIYFFHAKFRLGNVNFFNADFGSGDISFTRTEFGEGECDFSTARFGSGNVDFSNVDFGTGDLRFRETTFGSDEVIFQYCAFKGTTRFENIKGIENIGKLSFEGASFDKLFIFSHAGQMGCPLDLRRTRISHDIVVNDIKCSFDLASKPKWARNLSKRLNGLPESLTPAWRWTVKAKDREDSQRFRRLKELALANRNHAKALEFHVQEIQSKRGYETYWWQDAAQFLFWALGDYGRSIFRPLAWLLTTWLAFAVLFFTNRTQANAELASALAYSGSHMLSFIPTGRTARLQGQEALFGEGIAVPWWALGVGALESIISVILLFLLGLGLRNLFRV